MQFSHLDPDPAPQINADPCGFRMRIRNPGGMVATLLATEIVSRLAQLAGQTDRLENKPLEITERGQSDTIGLIGARRLINRRK